MAKPKYVTNAYAEAKANAEKTGTKFSGTKYDYYNHPNKEDGTPIYEMEESAIKENYKSFNGGQLYAACRALKIAYSTGTRNMSNAEVLSTLDDYFKGKKGKISMFVIVVIAVHSTRPHLSFFVVQLGIGAFGSKSGLLKNLYAQGKNGLKKEHEGRMNGQSKLSKTLSLVHTKKYIVGAEGVIHFRPTPSGPTSMAMAASEVGILDKLSLTAEIQMKRELQFTCNLVMDPREMTKKHETACGSRAGNNSAGVTFYHPDYDPNQPIDLLCGSLRKLTREEQEELFRANWCPGMFEQWKSSEYYLKWLRRSEALFKGGSGLPINCDSEPESHDEENRELVEHALSTSRSSRSTTSTSGRATRNARQPARHQRNARQQNARQSADQLVYDSNMRLVTVDEEASAEINAPRDTGPEYVSKEMKDFLWVGNASTRPNNQHGIRLHHIHHFC